MFIEDIVLTKSFLHSSNKDYISNSTYSTYFFISSTASDFKRLPSLSKLPKSGFSEY